MVFVFNLDQGLIVSIHNADLVKMFRYCPICTAELLVNELFSASGAKYCPEHGDFFIQKLLGQEPLIVFKKFDGRQHRSRFNAGRPNARIRCDQTGQVFRTQAEIVREMGLSQGNLSAHILGKRFAKHVGGYTFTVFELEENEED